MSKNNAELIAEARLRQGNLPYQVLFRQLADALEQSEAHLRFETGLTSILRTGLKVELDESRAEAASLREELRKTKESRNAGGR